MLQATRRPRFQTSSLARGFRAQRTTTIGMVVPDISSPFYAAALRGARHIPRGHGYTVLACETEERADREHEALALLGGDQAGLGALPRQPMASITDPALTTLSRSDYAVGTVAAELLLAQLGNAGSAARRERLLPLELVRRRSRGSKG